jgi:hypothetical protein
MARRLTKRIWFFRSEVQFQRIGIAGFATTLPVLLHARDYFLPPRRITRRLVRTGCTRLADRRTR